MDNRQIGQRIKDRRLELAMTLQEVASDVGVTKSTILRYERGQIETIKLPVIEAIARALRVTPEYLLGKTAEVGKPSLDEQLDGVEIALRDGAKRLTKQKKEALLSYLRFLEREEETKE